MLENLIKRAKTAYYNGNPIMSDEIFDYLVTMVTEESIGYKSSYERRYNVWVRGFAMALAWQLHVFAALILDQLLVVIPGGVRVVKVQVVTQTCSS